MKIEIDLKESINFNNSEHKKISDLLNKNIEEFDLSPRIYNWLKVLKLHTLKDIIKFRNFGKKNRKSQEELKYFLQEKGLSLDMDLTPYE